MKYIKEYNQYYYSTDDFNPNKNIISMKDNTIQYLDKLYDISVDSAYIDADSSLGSILVSFIKNDIKYITIHDYDLINVYEYEDEWYEVEHMPDDDPSTSYWCDQLDGVVKCINKIHQGSINENTYINISNNSEEYGSDILSVNDSDIKIIEDNVKLKFRKEGGRVVWYNYHYKGSNPQPYLDEIDISIFGYLDEWFKVTLTNVDNRSYYLVYWCDQVEGVIDCINDYMDKLKSEGITLTNDNHVVKYNETQYYTQEDSNDLRSGPHELITITDKNIDYIKKSLGITNRKNIIEYVRLISGTVVSYYCFYYNTKTGEVGNLNTMNNVFEKDTSFVRVYSYTDEWFSVMIGDNGYWCDQVEGVVQCVKDSINKDIYYNYIKEGGED